jgi:hypothetical protein
MATKNCSRSSGATIRAHVTQGAAFKRCCLKSGRYDGSKRNYFFQRLITGPPTSPTGGVGLRLRYRVYFPLYSMSLIAARRAAFASREGLSTSPLALPTGPSASGSLHWGQRLAKPGLSGFSSNSSSHTTQTLIGNAICSILRLSARKLNLHFAPSLHFPIAGIEPPLRNHAGLAVKLFQSTRFRFILVGYPKPHNPYA